MKELLIRPGKVAREYIEGRRKKYFSPMQFLILGVAVSTFITINFGIIGLRELPPELYSTLTGREKFFLQFNNFIYTYFNITLFAGVPIMAAFSRLVYAKSGYNYAEHFIFNTFIAGERSLFYVILSPLMYLYREKWYIGIGIYYILFITYFAFAYKQFFSSKLISGLLKFAAVFILSWAAVQSMSMFIFYVFFFKL
jgi:hypothetical protein